jgi:PIN domain nuclease of toxin-antitoxin system
VRLLLDTHALLWWLSDGAALGPQARALIADPVNDVLVSVASLWEIVVKVRVGKLDADIAAICAGAAAEGFITLDIRPAHLAALAALPAHHRDPFDHLLLAQAEVEGLTLVSADRQMRLYPVAQIAADL